jgi:hypothetical protein
MLFTCRRGCLAGTRYLREAGVIRLCPEPMEHCTGNGSGQDATDLIELAWLPGDVRHTDFKSSVAVHQGL